MSATPYAVFILEDNESFSVIIQKFLEESLQQRYPGRSFEIKVFEEANGPFREALRSTKPQVLVLDFHLGGEGEKEVTGIEVMKFVKDASPGTEVVMLTSDDSLSLANSMMRSGAFDYIIKSPASPIKVLKSVLTLLALSDARIQSETNRKLLYILGGAWFGLLLTGVLLKLLGVV